LCYLEDMNQEDMRGACALLYRHWADGTQLEALPPGLVPQTRAEAYRVQALLEGYSNAPLYGWKIAAPAWRTSAISAWTGHWPDGFLANA
jgi:hypothetical protein